MLSIFVSFRSLLLSGRRRRAALETADLRHGSVHLHIENQFA
jgi:hypothetical protein